MFHRMKPKKTDLGGEKMYLPVGLTIEEGLRIYVVTMLRHYNGDMAATARALEVSEAELEQRLNPRKAAPPAR